MAEGDEFRYRLEGIDGLNRQADRMLRVQREFNALRSQGDRTATRMQVYARRLEGYKARIANTLARLRSVTLRG